MPGVLVIQTTTIILLGHGGIFIIKQRVFLDAHVLTDKVALEQADVAEYLVLTVGELPVPHHDIQAENIRGLHHVDTARPQCRAGPLPQVAAIDGEGFILATGLLTQIIQQRLHMRKTTGAAILHCGIIKIEKGIGIGLRCIRTHPHRGQQLLAHQVRWPTKGIAHTQVDVRFAEVDRLQLPVHIGDMQESGGTLHRYIIETLRCACCGKRCGLACSRRRHRLCPLAAGDQTGNGRGSSTDSHDFQKFPTINEWHNPPSRSIWLSFCANAVARVNRPGSENPAQYTPINRCPP